MNKDAQLRLRRPHTLSPWASLGLRVGLALALIGIALAGHWLDRDGLKDNIDGHISFVDVLYFTAITVTTVGYGDIVPVTEGARLFDAFVLTPIRLFVWLIFLGTAYNFLLRRSWDRLRMRMIHKTLSGHHVVCGFGGTGEAAVGELLRAGVAAEMIVAVDPGPEQVAAALERGVLAIEGDATRNASLQAARVEAARSVLVCVGRDDTAALVTLTARQLAPRARISAVVLAGENEDLVAQAGADQVVNPTDLGGQLLAHAAGGPHVAAYVRDLVRNDGRVRLRERPVRAEEIGRSLRDVADGLGVQLQRAGRSIDFWEPDAAALAPGDVVVEIVPISA